MKKPGVPACAAFDGNLTREKPPQNNGPALFGFNARLIASNGTDRRLGPRTAQIGAVHPQAGSSVRAQDFGEAGGAFWVRRSLGGTVAVGGVVLLDPTYATTCANVRRSACICP